MTNPAAEPASADETELALLQVAASRYGVSAADLVALGAFESDVYSFVGPHGRSILKVMAPGHREPAQVQAEIDWLLALRAEGVSVAAPLRSVRGEYVETLTDSGHIVVAYEEAVGRLTNPEDWSESVIEGWGELLGRMHAHSRSWTPPGAKRRVLAEQSYAKWLDDMAEADPEFYASAKVLTEQAMPLLGGEAGADAAAAAAGRDVGLIHADLHHGNVLLDGNRWTAIDFDDCGYGSYAFDLAMPIYYVVRRRRDLLPGVALERFLPAFLRGFRGVARDPAGGAAAIDIALRFRQAELVLALRTKLPAERKSGRLHEFAKDLRDRVVAGVDVVPFDVLVRCLEG